MGVPIVRSANYDRNAARGTDDDTPCLICGKGVKDPWPHVVRLSTSFEALSDAEAKANPEIDMGAFPVGRSCWRNHPQLHDV